MRPTTPCTTSSDRNWIGRGVVRVKALRLLVCCQYTAKEADDKLNPKPIAKPRTRSLVNLTDGRFHSLNQTRKPSQGREDMTGTTKAVRAIGFNAVIGWEMKQ